MRLLTWLCTEKSCNSDLIGQCVLLLTGIISINLQKLYFHIPQEVVKPCSYELPCLQQTIPCMFTNNMIEQALL